MNKPFFILAPMDDVTDTVFRRIVADCAPPDLTMTEFVNVDGLKSAGRSRLIRKLGVEKDLTPVIAQIWGKTPEKFEAIACEIASVEIPGFVGIDINFGCPAKSEIRAGCCSALQQLELRPQAKAMIEATISGIKKACSNESDAPNRTRCMPLSFKTRLGYDEIDYTWHEFLLGFKPSMLTVHVRTTRQMSKVPAQWEAIEPIVALRNTLSPDTKVVLNGDILTRAQGEELAKEYKVDGIMIGRGIFQDPYVFAPESPWESKSPEERIALFKKHVLMHDEVFPDGQRPFSPLKKFAKVYISDFPGASELRAKIMETETVAEALVIVENSM